MTRALQRASDAAEPEGPHVPSATVRIMPERKGWLALTDILQRRGEISTPRAEPVDLRAARQPNETITKRPESPFGTDRQHRDRRTLSLSAMDVNGEGTR